MHALLWMVSHSNLVNITNLTWSRLRLFIFTKSNLLYWLSCIIGWDLSSCLTLWIELPLLGVLQSICCLCADMHTTLKLLAFSHSLHLFLYVGLYLYRCPISKLFQFSTHFCFLGASLSCLCLLYLTESNYLASFMLFSDCFCTLCASTHWAHNSTFLLAVLSMSFQHCYFSQNLIYLILVI